MVLGVVFRRWLLPVIVVVSVPLGFCVCGVSASFGLLLLWYIMRERIRFPLLLQLLVRSHVLSVLVYVAESAIGKSLEQGELLTRG